MARTSNSSRTSNPTPAADTGEDVTYIYVYRAGRPVPAGVLTFDRERQLIEFQYGRRYLARPDFVPVDPMALPHPDVQGTGNHYWRETPNDADLIFGGIRDAIPDGWGQHVLSQAAGGELTMFDYLRAAPNEHRVGALATGPDPDQGPRRVLPVGLPAGNRLSGMLTDEPALAGEALDLAAMQEAVDALSSGAGFDELSEVYGRYLVRGSSLGGARPKATTLYRGAPWIAKFERSDDRLPRPQMEYAAMRLAREVGLNVPEVALERVGQRHVYLIRRFDREPLTGAAQTNQGRDPAPAWDRIPFISGLTLLDVGEMEAHHCRYGQLAQELRRLGSEPVEDNRELFKRMVYNVLVNNDDDHLRNHGYLHDGREWRLSPLYDVDPRPLVGSVRRLALGLGHGREASLDNAIAAAPEFGLTHEQATHWAHAMRNHVAARWREIFRDAGLPARVLDRIAPAFAEATEADAPGDQGRR